ncbi:MAG TPA: tyrosine-protein phosphatase [Acetobacteraceae bacterium]|nr:tyrosine-protein phosphatase [Acetobacteraceae bacterium]
MFAGDVATGRGRLAAWSDSILVDHGFFRLAWGNFAPVVPGRLYRSNHPTPARLAAASRRVGIKTVINLRGRRACGSDALSREAAARLGLRHIDAPFESRGAPHRERVLALADIFRRMEEPALIHCKSGADRAGLAAAIFLLVNGRPLAEATAQLSWRFGHFRHARTGILDAFLICYAREGEGRKPFLDWVREDYAEAALRRDFVAGGLSHFLIDPIIDRVLRRE